MDAADVFRQGLGSVVPRHQQNHQNLYPRKSPTPYLSAPPHVADDRSESDGPPHRIAHTLTACCRCRQRKSRCDPTLPRCLPCERSGSICEYFDTAKGKKISRYYVVKLQDKVRQLEAELAQFTEEDHEYPRDNEELVRPGGLIRLSETDETPRYLGPSSGIAMTRIVMQEAKRYTESKSIADLIPEVRARRRARLDRMQSIAYGSSISTPGSRKKSYPMMSAHPAQTLPTRPIADKLVDVFNQRAQIFLPVLHERVLAKDLDLIFDGDKDPFRNFVIRMVMAISLQKLDTQYAGLADSYYLAAMQHFEDVVRPKDLKTLQCLVLIGQYSLLTPTRTAVYYIVGLATRICQQLGLGEEKTITAGCSAGLVDPQTLDLRRRLSWIVTANEFGLAHSMGRPNGFAKGDDLMDVKLFSTVDDENITEEGIKPGPPSQKKLVSIHFCKMRLFQAEMRRVLYEKKRAEPKNENHPWFAQMVERLDEWKDESPERPEWCKPWFTGRYHSMIIVLYRPSPQVPKPTPQAALRCFESATYVINLSSQQVKTAAIDITWVFLLTIYMSLNTILWAVSYPEVRAAHTREESEELVNTSLDIIDQCSERWPGTAAASQLYDVFAKACLQSFEAKERPETPTANGTFSTPPTQTDAMFSSQTSTPASASTVIASRQQNTQPRPGFNPPQFGRVFDSTPEQMAVAFDFDPQLHPTFRSDSIFLNPGTESYGGRRVSYFPPDFTQLNQSLMAKRLGESTPPAGAAQYNSQRSPPLQSPFTTEPASIMNTVANTMPTPPDSLTAQMCGDPGTRSISPTPTLVKLESADPTPTLPYATPATTQTSPVSVQSVKYEPDQRNMGHRGQLPSRATTFTIPPPPQSTAPRQRPLPPTTVTDWFNPPPPFIPAHTFPSAMGGGFWGTGDDNLMGNNATAAPFSGLGLGAGGGGGGGLYGLYSGRDFDDGPRGQAAANGGGAGGFPGFNDPGAQPQYVFPPERHGSLSVEQQDELMGVLETEGMSEIDAFLNGFGAGAVGGNVSWQ